MASANDQIRAAGVVCLREHPGGQGGDEQGPQVLLIHRTQIKDWSLPKGKLDSGEHVVVAAVRETSEETGFDVVLGVPLTTQRYLVGNRQKSVAYWLAHVVGRSSWAANHEVDEVRWVNLPEALEMLTYPRDAELVRSAASAARGTSPLIILRHAQAEKRGDFAKRTREKRPDDALRPLTRVGERQALDIVPVLAAFGITRVHSSPYARCLETVEPFAVATGVNVIPELLFSEAGFAQSRDDAMRRMSTLLHDPSPQVLCSHRPVLPAIFEQLRRDLGLTELDPDLPAGGFLVVHRDFSSGSVHVVAAEIHVP
jgi:8-oxo-dGTP diphosphatase